jgi:nitrate/nitrite transporter NarK
MPKPVLLFAAVALGQGLGAESDMIGYLIRRYFGIRSFGELSGYMLAIFAVGASVGPFAMGRCFDTTHSYDLALMIFIAACCVAAALVSRIGPYVFPAATSAESTVEPPESRNENVSVSVGSLATERLS